MSKLFVYVLFFDYRYAAILFKKQRYVSGQHKVNLKIVCKVRFNNIRAIAVIKNVTLNRECVPVPCLYDCVIFHGKVFM